MAGRSFRTAALAVAVLALAAGSVWAATINGTARNDTLRGGARADKIYGKGGDDRLFGAGGNDVLVGGPGSDVLVGGVGADTLQCGPGRDTAIRDVPDTVARDCEVVRGPKPVPAPPPPPPPPPPPSPPPPPPPVSPQATYELGTSVPASLQQLVQRALGFAGGYFRAHFARDLPPFSVYVYTDLEEIRAAWTRVQGGSTEDARRFWPSAEVRASAPPGKIFLLAVAYGSDANLTKIVIHEAFHVLQYRLLSGRYSSDPAVAPTWLNEGSAEYVAYQTIATYGLDSLENIRRSRIERVKTTPVPLRALETYAGFAPQNSPYPFSALAVDRLTEQGGETLLVAYFETVARGASWPEAFGTVFGRSVDAFYDEFEAYRRGL